jgi:FtsZ-binding cell division protein ZapB
MSEIDSVEAASRRLTLALDALDAAAERRREAAHGEQVLSAQIHSLGEDRARLASELDQAMARARALERANREVAQRITAVIESIRGALGHRTISED